LCEPQNKMCEMGLSLSKITPDISCHSPFKIKEQMPSGKYLDILLRCLQLLTLCSISFQAWAILYEHISHIAKAVKISNLLASLLRLLYVPKNFAKTFGKQIFSRKCSRKIFCQKLPKSNSAVLQTSLRQIPTVDEV
jgi:hypothetical protein